MMYELVKPYGPINNLDCELVRLVTTLCKYLEFDNWIVVMFSQEKLYRIIDHSFEDGSDWASHVNTTAGFNRLNEDSYLNLILEEKKIVIHSSIESTSNSSYRPLFEEASVELYFPLFSSNSSNGETLGCLCFMRDDPLNKRARDIVTGPTVNTEMSKIQPIFEAIYRDCMDHIGLFNLIHIFSEIIKVKEPFIKSHSYNVAFLSHLIGQKLDFSPNQLLKLYIAAILHDIGNLYIPESILGHEGIFTDAERMIMQRHPIYSHNIVEDLIPRFPSLAGIEEIVLKHHERYDGTGYPNCIKGEDIPLMSRILTVADAVDSMLSGRVYKKSKSINSIINELLNNRGRQFDPYIANIMVEILVKKQKEQDLILSNPMTIGTIQLFSKDKSCQIPGMLIGTESEYRFRTDCDDCFCEKCICDLSDIVNATFHTEENGRVYGYDAVIIHRDSRDIYISKLDPIQIPNYFSLTWELSGELSVKGSLPFEVDINSVGGDLLSFSVDDNQALNRDTLEKANLMTIDFDDGYTIQISGKVINIVKIGPKTHCDFQYINILDGTRDKIFRQIFKKQAKFTKNLFNIMNKNN